MLQKTQRFKTQNKLVLITGSGHGLGRELALVFASHGYDIVLTDRNKNDLEESRKEISKTSLDQRPKKNKKEHKNFNA